MGLFRSPAPFGAAAPELWGGKGAGLRVVGERQTSSRLLHPAPGSQRRCCLPQPPHLPPASPEARTDPPAGTAPVLFNFTWERTRLMPVLL